MTRRFTMIFASVSGSNDFRLTQPPSMFQLPPLPKSVSFTFMHSNKENMYIKSMSSFKSYQKYTDFSYVVKLSGIYCDYLHIYLIYQQDVKFEKYDLDNDTESNSGKLI